MIARLDLIRGAMLGLAVGDALGAPVEGAAPHRAAAFVAAGLEMSGGAGWAPGEWTDDTAMALALAESIVERGLIDVDDVARRYIEWAIRDGKGIGRATANALIGAGDAASARARARAYFDGGNQAAGNGTVMRVAPVALTGCDFAAAIRAAGLDAELTHADPAAAAASMATAAALLAVRCEAVSPLFAARELCHGHGPLADSLGAVERGGERRLGELAAGLECGACWTTLAIALYAVSRFDDYEDAIGWAIAQGGDTDTNAAVVGAFLGLRVGAGAIPERWLGALRDRERIERAADGLLAAGEFTPAGAPPRQERPYRPAPGWEMVTLDGDKSPVAGRLYWAVMDAKRDLERMDG
ncbi:MAG: ADP-ribosylglycohydrolase family protein [Solirubrobacteraceae bacterium]